MKAFIASQFGYCQLVWMFNSRKSSKLPERASRTIYQDYGSPFTELLQKDNSTTIRNRNIQLLATVKNGLSPPFMNEISMENAQNYYDLKVH